MTQLDAMATTSSERPRSSPPAQVLVFDEEMANDDEPNAAEENDAASVAHAPVEMMQVAEDGDADDDDEQPVADDQFWVDEIVRHRRRGNQLEFFVKWHNYPSNENTWEPEVNVAPTAAYNAYMENHSVKRPPAAPAKRKATPATRRKGSAKVTKKTTAGGAKKRSPRIKAKHETKTEPAAARAPKRSVPTATHSGRLAVLPKDESTLSGLELATIFSAFKAPSGQLNFVVQFRGDVDVKVIESGELCRSGFAEQMIAYLGEQATFPFQLDLD